MGGGQQIKEEAEKRCLLCGKNKAENWHSCDKCGAQACSARHLRVHRGGNLSNSADASSDCLPFIVANDEIRGRHFIATREIQPLDLVLIDSASVIGPATKTRPVCLECLRPVAKDTAYYCPGCRFPMCSKDCLDNGSIHGPECKLLSGFPASEIPFSEESPVYAAVFILRFWRLLEIDPEEHSEVTFLMTGDTSGSDLKSTAMEITRIIQTYFGQPSFELSDALRYMGIKRTNANNLGGSLKGRVGNILYPYYTLINSHCYCNTSCKIDPSTLRIEVRAQRPISAGEEITTRYVSSIECQPRRQAKIWRNWNFVCACARCSDPTELGTFFSAQRCKTCPDGFMLPMLPAMLGSPWQCNGCKRKVSPRDVEDRLQALERLIRADPPGLEDSLGEELHPTHMFLFCQQERRLFTRNRKDVDNTEGLARRINLATEMLSLLGKLDPGLTARRGKIIQVLAKDRMCLAKLLMEGVEEAKAQMAQAKEDLKLASLCLKYA